ncbi:MAG: type II toxin-antitoxin system HicB family antitoxin [Elusimicrobia bacterium]|nr:type II toxin-antitoxin system HicB family antitoxin [Elusimicrobiota bacterium]
MKSYKFPVVIELDEDGYYIGIVPDLKGCHTQARTLVQLEKRLKEAIALCLGAERKTFHQNKFVGLHQVELTA